MPRMRRRLAVAVIATTALMGLFSVGKAVLFAASKSEAGTPSTADLIPLAAGLRVVAETTFDREGNLGGGTRVLVLGAVGRATSGSADVYLDALEARGWERASDRAAIAPDQSFCAVAEDLSDFLADPNRARDITDFVRAQRPDAPVTAVVTAGIC